jgi:hypothetical protein
MATSSPSSKYFKNTLHTDTLSAAHEHHLTQVNNTNTHFSDSKAQALAARVAYVKKTRFYYVLGCILLFLNLLIAIIWTQHGATLDFSQDIINPIVAPEKINTILNASITMNRSTSDKPEPLPQAGLIPPESTSSACYYWELANDAEISRANLRLSKAGWTGYSIETIPLINDTNSNLVRYRFEGLTSAHQQSLVVLVKTLGVLRRCEH